jgi:hypothetical protein
MRRSLRWLIATAGASLAFAALPAAALATSQPSIESAVAYQVTEHDATLEAKINPESLGGERGAYYQFEVVANTSEYSPEIICPVREIWPLGLDGCIGTHAEALPIGFIERGTYGSYVHVDLAKAGLTLTPGTTYHYRVLAARAKQTEDTLEWEAPPVVGPDQTFTTLTPGTPPAIESESASNITATDATLEAKINPEGLETTYEFYLEAPSCATYGPGHCEASGGVVVVTGTIPAGSVGQSVNVDLAAVGHSLSPDMIDGYRVVASNSAGTRYHGENTFVTLPGAPPVVESVSLSHLTPTDATLEAKINTEGLPTTYQFDMWASCAHEECEYMRPITLPYGRLLGSFVGQSVSLDLSSAGVTLKYGEEYGWGIIATSGGGHASANGKVFEPPLGVFEPLGPTVTPGPTDPTPVTSNDGSQSAGSGSSSSTTPGTSSTLGASSKTGAGTTGGKPKAKHGKHHKRKHHGKKTPKHPAKSEKHKG